MTRRRLVINSTLDAYFPVLVLVYGFLAISFSWLFDRASQNTTLQAVAHHPFIATRLAAMKALGLPCFLIGALWTAQNLWTGSI